MEDKVTKELKFTPDETETMLDLLYDCKHMFKGKRQELNLIINKIDRTIVK